MWSSMLGGRSFPKCDRRRIIHADRNTDHGRATAPVAWQELGALAVNAAAAHGSCFLLGPALRGFWISRIMMRDDEPTPALVGTSGPIERMVSHPPQPLPTYSPSVRVQTMENTTAKGLTVNQTANHDAERPNKMVRHFTTGQLLGRRVPVPPDSTISMTKNDGRLKLRVESPRNLDREEVG
jgi:hypothetical protein